MSQRVWGIKLGSDGRCVSFCERHGIVGVGWKSVAPSVITRQGRDQIWAHVKSACDFYKTNREIGVATGQLYRFAQACAVGDYVLYYNPRGKCVRVCRVTSDSLFRDFDPDDSADIWHYRKVEYAADPIPILDFYGGLKGSLTGPRMSFWDMGPVWSTVDLIARGVSPSLVAAPDPALQAAYREMQKLVIQRTEVLNEKDWEWLVVDYLKAQGAFIDERQVGGSYPIIDVEAVFDHGEFGRDVWRVQVKRYQNRVVDWPEIEQDYRNVGEAGFCFVSVFGFTDLARQRAEEEGIRLMEAGDFVRFLLAGKHRRQLQDKLQLPLWGG